MKVKLTIFFLILQMLFIFAGCNRDEGKKENSAKDELVNSIAPDFSLKDLNGNEFRLSDHNGKVRIIDFWATWCPPCRMEIPDFQTLHNKYSEKGFVMIGVSLDDSSDIVKKFVNKYQVTYPIVMGNEEVVNLYGGIRGIPTTFIVDKDGKIFKKYVGYR
ncbi:MAG: TlpA family protein disulfide reductase, partial [Candidatus Schekmanbacteria bacterium]